MYGIVLHRSSCSYDEKLLKTERVGILIVFFDKCDKISEIIFSYDGNKNKNSV